MGGSCCQQGQVQLCTWPFTSSLVFPSQLTLCPSHTGSTYTRHLSPSLLPPLHMFPTWSPSLISTWDLSLSLSSTQTRHYTRHLCRHYLALFSQPLWELNTTMTISEMKEQGFRKRSDLCRTTKLRRGPGRIHAQVSPTGRYIDRMSRLVEQITACARPCSSTCFWCGGETSHQMENVHKCKGHGLWPDAHLPLH